LRIILIFQYLRTLSRIVISIPMTQLKPNSERAKKAKIILIVCVSISGIYLLQSLFELQRLSAFGDGRSFYIDDYLDRKDPLAALTQINSIASLLAIVSFIQWFRRAYYNLHLRAGGLKYGEGAAAWSWFVPILNFFVPLVIMRELIDKSQETLKQNGVEMEKPITANYANWWWISYWGATVFSIAGILFLLNMNFSSIYRGQMYIALSQALIVISGVLVIHIIKKYSALEERLEGLVSEIDQIGLE